MIVKYDFNKYLSPLPLLLQLYNSELGLTASIRESVCGVCVYVCVCGDSGGDVKTANPPGEVLFSVCSSLPPSSSELGHASLNPFIVLQPDCKSMDHKGSRALHLTGISF
jgi:hypothetical protein